MRQVNHFRPHHIATFLLQLVQLLSSPSHSVAFAPAILNRRTQWATHSSLTRRFVVKLTSHKGRQPGGNECTHSPAPRTSRAVAKCGGHFPTVCSLALLLHVSAPAAVAFDDNDYASDTVQVSVDRLLSTVGNTEKSFNALKDVADIITEGKGVGGSIDYGGVQLQRGLVSDEDTAIYNPGLTLLTESEKERLVDAVINNRKGNISQKTWSEDNELGFDFLKTKLDPLHMYELSGYLNLVPAFGAVVYLAALFVQQNIRGLFAPAYIIGAIAVFGPIAVLIATGP